MGRQNRNAQRGIMQANQGRRQAMQQRLRQKKDKQYGPPKDFLDDVVVPGTIQETPTHEEELHHQIIRPGTIMVSNAKGICTKNKSGNCGKQAFAFATLVGKHRSGHRDFMKSETNWTGKKLSLRLFQEEGSEHFSFVFSVILPPGMIIRTAGFGFHAAVAVRCGAHYVMKDPAQLSFGPTQDDGYYIRALNWMKVDELLDPSLGYVDRRGNLTIEVAVEVYLIPPDELEELTKPSPSLLQQDENKVINEPQLGGSKEVGTGSSDSPDMNHGPLSATGDDDWEPVDERAQGQAEPDSPSTSVPIHISLDDPITLPVVSPTSVVLRPRRKGYLPTETLEFKLPNFAGLDLERGRLIMLHSNKPGNHPWKLVIFPRGHSSSSNETEYVSCFLRSHSKSRGKVTAKARILCNNHLTKIQRLTYDWLREWGAVNWIERSEILDASNGFLDSQGCLTITVEVMVRKHHN